MIVKNTMHKTEVASFKRILLVNPPNSILKDSARRISEPLGLLYMGTKLKKEGFDVCVYDMACEGYDNCVYEGDRVTYGSSMDDLRAKISDFSPDLVGVTCMYTTREKNTLDVCSVIKELLSDVPVVVGGVHPSLYPKTFIKTGCVDYVIIGEGEFRLGNLLGCLNDNRLPDFDGVAYERDGEIRLNPRTSRIDDLDSIPNPDRMLIDMEKYISIGAPFAPFSAEERVANVLTTRGCPFNCNFCATVRYWGRRLRHRSVDNIIEELKELRDKYDIREIQFVDDNVTINVGFAKELFRRMKEFDFKFCTPTGLYFNTIDAELMKLMAEAGAYQLTFAVESASKRVLKDIIHKDVDLDRVKEVVEEAHKYDIGVHGMFVVGFPGERREEILSTFEFPFKAGFDSVAFFIACPMPGSDLFKECEEKGYLPDNFSVVDLKLANIRIPEGSPDYFMDPDELIKLVDEKTHEFNEWSRKKYPKRWAKKFDRYLERHPEQREVIMGRVT